MPSQSTKEQCYSKFMYIIVILLDMYSKPGLSNKCLPEGGGSLGAGNYVVIYATPNPFHLSERGQS